MTDRWLDVSTIARLLAVSDESVRAWIGKGWLSAERHGGKWKIRSSEFARFKNSQKSQGHLRKRLGFQAS